MPKKNSTVKAVRIDNDILAELEAKLGERTINSWLNEQIEGYVRGSENEPKWVNPQNFEKSRSASPELRDIEQMVSLSGLTMDDFYTQIDGLMNEGSFNLTGGKISINYPNWFNDFVETCHDCSVPVEEAIKRATKALRKGSI